MQYVIRQLHEQEKVDVITVQPSLSILELDTMMRSSTYRSSLCLVGQGS